MNLMLEMQSGKEGEKLHSHIAVLLHLRSCNSYRNNVRSIIQKIAFLYLFIFMWLCTAFRIFLSTLGPIVKRNTSVFLQLLQCQFMSCWFWSIYTGNDKLNDVQKRILSAITQTQSAAFIMVCYPITQDIKILRRTWRNAAARLGPVPSYNAAFPFQSYLTHFID